MGAVLSIDYGLKRIGLAISDESRSFAFPYNVIENKNFSFILSIIKKVINEKEIDLIIVGFPLNMDSTESSMTKKVLDFVKKIQEEIKIPIETIDERLSSFAASENLKDRGLTAKKLKEHIDVEAARLLLEEYLQKIQKE